jgi:hypothetical protein
MESIGALARAPNGSETANGSSPGRRWYDERNTEFLHTRFITGSHPTAMSSCAAIRAAIIQENRTPDNLFYKLCVPDASACIIHAVKTSNWFDKSYPAAHFHPLRRLLPTISTIPDMTVIHGVCDWSAQKYATPVMGLTLNAVPVPVICRDSHSAVGSRLPRSGQFRAAGTSR